MMQHLGITVSFQLNAIKYYNDIIEHILMELVEIKVNI